MASPLAFRVQPRCSITQVGANPYDPSTPSNISPDDTLQAAQRSSQIKQITQVGANPHVTSSTTSSVSSVDMLQITSPFHRFLQRDKGKSSLISPPADTFGEYSVGLDHSTYVANSFSRFSL